jgi:hypothetical protein
MRRCHVGFVPRSCHSHHPAHSLNLHAHESTTTHVCSALRRYLPGLTPYNKSVYYNWGTDPVTNKTSPATRASTCGVASFDMAAGGAWGWNDTRCADPYVFVCRVRYPCSVTPPSYTASTGATFQYFPCNLTYDKAEVECNKVGGHLAGYRSEAEQREVEKVGCWLAHDAWQPAGNDIDSVR